MSKLSAYDTFELRYDSIQDGWEQRKLMYQDYYRQIRAQDRTDSSAKPWGAKVNSQFTHTQLNTFTDFTMAGMLPTAPYLYAECRDPYRLLNTEGPATEEFYKRLKTMRFYRTMRRWIRSATSYGVGIVKLTGSGRPMLQLVDSGNMAWSPGATDLRTDARWVMERYKLTLGDIKQLSKAGVFKKGIKNLKDWAFSPPIDEATAERYEQRHGYAYETAQIEDDTELDIIDMVSPDRIVTVHRDSMTVLRDIPNPYGYIPYYDLSAYFELLDVHGFALPELLEDIQDEINTTRRQRIDIASLEASPMMAVARSAGLDTNRIVIRPGGVLSLNNPQTDVKWLQAQDSTQSLLQIEMNLQQDGDRITAVQAQTRGERGEQMKATVASIINANVNVRFQVNINDMIDYPLRDLFADMVQLSILDDGPMAITEEEWARVVEAAEFDKLELVPHAEAFVGQGPQKFQLMANMSQFLLQAGIAPQGYAEHIKEMYRLIQVRDPERITQYLQGAPPPGAGGAAGAAGGGQLAAPATPGPALAAESARGVSPGQSAMSARTPV